MLKFFNSLSLVELSKNQLSKIVLTASALGVAAMFGTAAISQEPQQGTPQPAQQGVPFLPPGESIAALVNDKPITTFDLRQRLKLILLSSGGRLRADQVAQLEQNALRDLIEEKFKIKALELFEVKTSDRDVDNEMRRIASQASLSVDELASSLTSQGISLNSWREQIRISIGWQNLVQGRFSSRVKINEREVDLTLETIRDDATKERFLVSELCIPVEDTSQIQAYYQAGLELIEQLRRGVPFAAAAQNFSGCTSASIGGDIGWVHAGELPKELDEAIRAIPVGSVTNPIPSGSSLMIMALRDKKEPREQGEQSFTLAYASAPISIGENNARIALQKLPTAEVCNSRAIKLDLGPNVDTYLLESVALSDIHPRFARFIEDLTPGDSSAVIEADDYLHMVYVCEKDEGYGLPPRAAIEDRIFGRQLTLLGQRYLRDLERESTVEMLIAQQPPNGR